MHTCAGELALNLLVNIDESVEDFSHCGLAFSHLCQVNTHRVQTDRWRRRLPFCVCPAPKTIVSAYEYS